MGGGSWGGETCGVTIAGSLLGSDGILGFPSWEDVPAGVSGGECMAVAGGDGRTALFGRDEWPEAVRDAGDGEGA
jgi:hypothetical protein